MALHRSYYIGRDLDDRTTSEGILRAQGGNKRSARSHLTHSVSHQAMVSKTFNKRSKTFNKRSNTLNKRLNTFNKRSARSYLTHSVSHQAMVSRTFNKRSIKNQETVENFAVVFEKCDKNRDFMRKHLPHQTTRASPKSASGRILPRKQHLYLASTNIFVLLEFYHISCCDKQALFQDSHQQMHLLQPTHHPNPS